MNNIISSMIAMILFNTTIIAQEITFKALILDEASKEPIVGATFEFENLKKGKFTDPKGFVIVENIPLGQQAVHISHMGYEAIKTTITVSANAGMPIYYLHHVEEKLEELLVRVTRSTRTIQNIPTRIETVTLEEVGKKAIMNSANISLILRESTGIQMQQSSLNSANSSIRIQGLDGRYTQLLRDGFPIYGGLSSNLSIIHIPPLDLFQFEIVKGSSSTLYGSGAIAGLVNMVTKTPKAEPTLDILLTQTHAGGSSANVFFGQKKGKLGYTFYGAGNYQQPYDPDGDSFTNLPLTKTLTFNPKIFYDPSHNTSLWFGINSTIDDRIGGDLLVVENRPGGLHQFFEDNYSVRISTQAVFELRAQENELLQIRNSVSYFDRSLLSERSSFIGEQWNTFSELTYSIQNEESDWIFGMNAFTNNFKESDVFLPRDQEDFTFGVFAQNATDLSEHWIVESGIRVDHSIDWGLFALPSLSILWKASPKVSSRFGGGFGYKIPDIFTEEAAMRNYVHIFPIDASVLEAERSYGLNWDVNFTTALGDALTFSINQLVYVTSIENALLFNTRPDTRLEFVNANGNVLSRGSETNIKLTYKDLRFLLNYAFIEATLNYLPGNPVKPLTAKHNAGSILMYENENWRIGYEIYYTGEQRLSTGETTDDFIIMGILLQKHFKWGSPFVNFENFTDMRQSKFSPEVLPPYDVPIFPQIYAPTDGFIFSAGVVLNPFGREKQHQR